MNIITIIVGFVVGITVMYFVQRVRNRTPLAQREEAAALGKTALAKYQCYRLSKYGKDDFSQHVADSEQDMIKRAIADCNNKSDLEEKMRLLRNLAAHVDNRSYSTITQVMHYAENGYDGEPPLLTEEHFFIFNELGGLKENDYGSFGEWEQIAGYALTHIEDGRMIVSLTRDRGIRTLDGIISMMSTIKQSTHATLSEGAL